MPNIKPQPQLGMVELVALLALVTSLNALSIDGMLPALTTIGDELKVSDLRDTQLVVSMFILGMVGGDLVFGPLADAIGRKPAILVGLAIYAIGNCIAIGAGSLDMLLAGRILQGFGASGPKIASRALIRDQFEGEAMARIMSFIFTVFILVPIVAPSIGQLLVIVSGWRAIFVGYLVMAAITALWLGRRQPETLPVERRIPIRPATLLRNSALILRNRPVMACTLAAGLVFGAVLSYVSMAPAMFRDVFGETTRFPLLFAILASAFGASSFINGRFVQRIGMARMARRALAGLAVTSGTHLLIGLAFGGRPPLLLFMALCLAMFFCMGFLFGNLNAMAMRSLGHVAGIAASLISSISSLVAVLLAVAMGRLYDGTITPTVLAFLVAGVLGLGLLTFARQEAPPPGHASP